MPNWCNNTIQIEGPADRIRALWEAAQPVEGKEGSLLEAMVPIGDWDYGTAIDTWGTKWDVNIEGLLYEELSDGRAMIHGWFESAWAPPREAMNTFCETNEDVYVCLSYFEPGIGFLGIWDNKDIGDVVYEDISALIADKAEDDDDQLMELFEEFNVWSYYDLDNEETFFD
jgi:hypothetical protein